MANPIPSRLRLIVGLVLALVGAVLILDGLLPTRSGSPNPSWLVVAIGTVLCVAGWMLRRAALRN